MSEKELMHWLMTTVVPIALSALTFYFAARNSTSSLEHRLTRLESDNEYRTKILEEYKIRLDNHDKQNEALIRMTEQISNLSQKVDEINKKLDGGI